ncbi:hypothetical protein GGS23DRAFT_547101 [Durotheca rogersii]|uniref:uncharacterized protein n=1 Tax=Durotheca rogersii TaxID=419775 RepID=UPI0022212671|nr:uncharacterized protein GGS23DRAFT_547101 [Durotheca rogersii]KAI5867159.1 hypothetical protein GGS23DRAFT_547101 [Durotheca rogersii]
MFDVLWTDPNRELMGEKIIRKEQEAKEREKRQKSDRNRQSFSTESTTSSDRSFRFFGSRSRRKAQTPPQAEDKGAPASPSASLADHAAKVSRTSGYHARPVLHHRDSSRDTTKPAQPSHPSLQLPEINDGSSSLSSPDSTLSKWTQQTTATNNTGIESSGTPKPENLVQTLGPSSFVTRRTDVISSTRDPETDLGQLFSQVYISADREKVKTPSISELPEEANPVAFDDPGSITPLESPRTPPPIELQHNLGRYNANWSGSDRLANPDAWKPPHEWDGTLPKDDVLTPDQEALSNATAGGNLDRSMSPTLKALQREVRMMAAAGPELMLANIKCPMGHGLDATVYKELEMAKKRWMFSALRHEGYMSLVNHNDNCLGNLDPSRPPRLPPRILALYETQASASFLAALYPQVSISHLSPNPISSHSFSNVNPILVPGVSASAGSRSLTPQLYFTATCLSMPALFPSSEIPLMLRHIYRCLAPDGALHLTLIDPQPVSSSMGPKFRQWLFEKLLIQLEKRCRTTYPSGTFPAWLAVAKLRGFGSTITTVSVRAVHQGGTVGEDAKGRGPVEGELRCLVARMLWQEVWGEYVHANRWWWEEEEIVQECVERGTYWQYSHVVAVKSGR